MSVHVWRCTGMWAEGTGPGLCEDGGGIGDCIHMYVTSECVYSLCVCGCTPATLQTRLENSNDVGMVSFLNVPAAPVRVRPLATFFSLLPRAR